MWSFRLLQREVSEPLASIPVLLGDLEAVRRGMELAESGDADALTEAREALARIEQSPWSRFFGGAQAVRILDDTLDRGRDPAVGDHERSEAFDTGRRIVARMQQSVYGSAELALAHSADIRAQLLLVLGLALLSALLLCALGALLIRRWVLKPVGELRTATARIAAGDFSHRTPVAGSDELAQLSAEVNQMAGMVSAMQEERIQRERLAAIGEVVRRLAHNLRNPLSGIRSLAELSRDELDEASELRENQDRIVGTVDRFERWLTELLEATSPLAIVPGEHEVGGWLEGLIAAHTPAAESRDVRITVDTGAAPTRARFDRRHLEQAVVAILTNAIEASPRGGIVAVGAKEGEDGRFWELQIADEGTGVSEELTGKIFAAHFTTKAEGTGIGLAVAQQVVRGHGGALSVRIGDGQVSGADSEVKGGRGATFVIRLPVEARGDETPESDPDV